MGGGGGGGHAAASSPPERKPSWNGRETLLGLFITECLPPVIPPFFRYHSISFQNFISLSLLIFYRFISVRCMSKYCTCIFSIVLKFFFRMFACHKWYAKSTATFSFNAILKIEPHYSLKYSFLLLQKSFNS